MGLPNYIQGASDIKVSLPYSECYQIWDVLGDPLLSSLIRQAYQSNLDLKIARLRITQSREQLFGARIIEDSEDDFQETWNTVSTDVAKTYVEFKILQQRLVVIQKSIDAKRTVLNLAQDLLNRGLNDESVLNDAKEDYHNSLAQKTQLQSSLDKALYHMAELLDESPSKIFVSLKEVNAFASLPIGCRPRITEELLKERPDVRKAERNFANACKQVERSLAFLEFRQTFQKALEEAESASLALQEEIQRNCLLKTIQKDAYDSFQESELLFQRGLKDHFDLTVSMLSLLKAEDERLQGDAELLYHYIALQKAL